MLKFKVIEELKPNSEIIQDNIDELDNKKVINKAKEYDR